jgi:DNA-directed RNA polymerase specialized sigma24 family protein
MAGRKADTKEDRLAAYLHLVGAVHALRGRPTQRDVRDWHKSLATLPGREQSAIILRYLRGAKIIRVAELLDLGSKQRAEQLFLRGLDRLQRVERAGEPGFFPGDQTWTQRRRRLRRQLRKPRKGTGSSGTSATSG